MRSNVSHTHLPIMSVRFLSFAHCVNCIFLVKKNGSGSDCSHDEVHDVCGQGDLHGCAFVRQLCVECCGLRPDLGRCPNLLICSDKDGLATGCVGYQEHRCHTLARCGDLRWCRCGFPDEGSNQDECHGKAHHCGSHNNEHIGTIRPKATCRLHPNNTFLSYGVTLELGGPYFRLSSPSLA